MQNPSESEIDAARSVLQRDYWSDVQNVVDNAKDEIKAGSITDEEALRDWLDETCDGHSRVIYTRDAILCLLFSSHDGEYWDAVGDDSGWPNMGFSTVAYHAFRADVDDEIGDYSELFEETEDDTEEDDTQ